MLRPLVSVSLGIASGMFAFAVGAGITSSWVAATSVGIGAGAVTGLLFWKRVFFELDESACSRWLGIVSALATLLALLQLARLTVFIVAPSLVDFSQFRSSDFEVHHSCVSAYYVAAQTAGDSPNVYDGSLYTAPDDDPTKIRKPKRLGPFNIDVYEYPPPFLTLPRALLMTAPEFPSFRMVWFGLNGGALLAAFVLVARSLGSAAGTRALLLSPLLLASIPTINFLQKGNVQGLVIAMAVVAMLCFERRRWAWGGALLAFATVSKLFPGLLLFFLIAQRRWRPVIWTIGLSVAFALLTAIDIGAASYAAFLEHLPGLLGGEAFPAFRNPVATAINISVPGLVFKLKLFDVPGMGFAASKIVGWAYTAVALVATFLASKRPLPDEEKPLLCLAILIVATLRSPFLPQAYASFPPLWLATLLAAKAEPNAKTLGVLLGVWFPLSIYWPIDWPIDPRWLATIMLVPQAITIALAARVLMGRVEVGGGSGTRRHQEEL
jgi:alpha-1,2-mannosyltransferase